MAQTLIKARRYRSFVEQARGPAQECLGKVDPSRVSGDPVGHRPLAKGWVSFNPVLLCPNRGGDRCAA